MGTKTIPSEFSSLIQLKDYEEVTTLVATEGVMHLNNEEMSLKVSTALFNDSVISCEDATSDVINAMRWGWIERPIQPDPLVYPFGGEPTGVLWVVYIKIPPETESPKL